nr:MAG TPA: hypothetical protein [Caudoviricetes sp.]
MLAWALHLGPWQAYQEVFELNPSPSPFDGLVRTVASISGVFGVEPQPVTRAG